MHIYNSLNGNQSIQSVCKIILAEYSKINIMSSGDKKNGGNISYYVVASCQNRNCLHQWIHLSTKNRFKTEPCRYCGSITDLFVTVSFIFHSDSRSIYASI